MKLIIFYLFGCIYTTSFKIMVVIVRFINWYILRRSLFELSEFMIKEVSFNKLENFVG